MLGIFEKYSYTKVHRQAIYSANHLERSDAAMSISFRVSNRTANLFYFLVKRLRCFFRWSYAPVRQINADVAHRARKFTFCLRYDAKNCFSTSANKGEKRKEKSGTVTTVGVYTYVSFAIVFLSHPGSIIYETVENKEDMYYLPCLTRRMKKFNLNISRAISCSPYSWYDCVKKL